jgi:CheY-like chemotaxis protein/anti-sigma regulatory factor (Ser/Thr protein kinase)
MVTTGHQQRPRDPFARLQGWLLGDRPFDEVVTTMSPRPARVLLVDDDEDLRRLLRRTLGTHPAFEIAGEASDGQSALDVAARERPDVVILDLGLPDIAGGAVLTELRSHTPQPRVVIFTGTTAAARPLLGTGAAGVVHKGGDLAPLVRVLEEITRWLLEASVELPRDDVSVVRARRFVREMLETWRCPPNDDAVLVVSELVTNALVHAKSGVWVTLRARGGRVRVEVADRGAGSPEPRAPSPETVGGRGLLLVAAVAETWGIDPSDDGKVVWAELET